MSGQYKRRPPHYDAERNQVVYPWKRWFSKKGATVLVRRRDYQCLTHSMAQQVRNAARLYGYRVHIIVGDASVTFSSRRKRRG